MKNSGIPTVTTDPWGVPGFVYLYHFRRRLGRPGRNGAAHYVGFVEGTDPKAVIVRGEKHRRGNGSRIMNAAYAAHCEPILVKVWIGSRNDERRFKRAGHFDRACPVCKNTTDTLPLLVGSTQP